MEPLPNKLIDENGVEMTTEYYCAEICPNRFDSECFSFCSLSQAMHEEDYRDNDPDPPCEDCNYDCLECPYR